MHNYGYLKNKFLKKYYYINFNKKNNLGYNFSTTIGKALKMFKDERRIRSSISMRKSEQLSAKMAKLVQDSIK